MGWHFPPAFFHKGSRRRLAQKGTSPMPTPTQRPLYISWITNQRAANPGSWLEAHKHFYSFCKKNYLWTQIFTHRPWSQRFYLSHFFQNFCPFALYPISSPAIGHLPSHHGMQRDVWRTAWYPMPYSSGDCRVGVGRSNFFVSFRPK